MSGQPTQAEVLAWLERTGGTLGEAVANFWPQVTDEDMRETLYQRVKKWRQRSGMKAEAPAPRRHLELVPTPVPEGSEPAAPTTAPAPTVDLAAMSPRERLEWQLQQLSALHAEAMTRRDVRAVTLLSQQIREVGAELDAAKQAEGLTVPLQPIPAQVAKDIADESRVIQMLVQALEALQTVQPTQPTEG